MSPDSEESRIDSLIARTGWGSSGVTVVRKAGSSYQLNSTVLEVQVTSAPRASLRLRLVDTRPTLRPPSATPLYQVDTDLYNSADPKLSWFFDEVEDEILFILEAFHQGEIRTGSHDGRNAICMPVSEGGYKLITVGRFLVTARPYQTYSEAVASGGFVESR